MKHVVEYCITIEHVYFKVQFGYPRVKFAGHLMWYNPYCLRPLPPIKVRTLILEDFPDPCSRACYGALGLLGSQITCYGLVGRLFILKPLTLAATCTLGISAPAEAPIWDFETLLAKLKYKDILGPIILFKGT